MRSSECSRWISLRALPGWSGPLRTTCLFVAESEPKRRLNPAQPWSSYIYPGTRPEARQCCLAFGNPSQNFLPIPSWLRRRLVVVEEEQVGGRNGSGSELRRRDHRQRDLHPRLRVPDQDVPADREEQEHGGLPVASLRDHPAEHLALDLLRPAQARRPPRRHRQRRRRRARGRIRHALPHLRAQGDKGEDGEAGAGRERRLPRGGRLGHADGAARRRQAARRGVAVRRADHRDVRRADGRNADGGEDPERGVHALLPVLLPLPQRRRLERLLRARQGLLHRSPQRHRLRPGHGAAGAVHGVPEGDAGAGAQGGRRRRRRGRGGGGGRGGRAGAPDGAAGGDGAAAGGAAPQGAQPAQARRRAALVAARRARREHHQVAVGHTRRAPLRHAPARARPVRARRQGRRRRRGQQQEVMDLAIGLCGSGGGTGVSDFQTFGVCVA